MVQRFNPADRHRQALSTQPRRAAGATIPYNLGKNPYDGVVHVMHLLEYSYGKKQIRYPCGY